MDEHELTELETQVRREVTADLRATLDQLQATLTAIYVTVAGSTRHKLPPAARDAIRQRLLAALDHVQANTSHAGNRATLRGAARALIAAGADSTGLDVTVPRTTPLDLRAALTALTAGMRNDLTAANRLAKHGRLERYGDVMSVVMAARKALNRADRTAAWVTHRAHDEGVKRAVDKAWSQGVEVARVWVAEREACPFCLSLAGAIARVGEPFVPLFHVADHDATGPIWGPPDPHPFCRCTTREWLGPTGDERLGPTDELTPLDLPYALRREAQRTIATGRGYGSEPARVRAADRLLDVGGLLIPKSVQRKARDAVKAGTFNA